MPFAPDYSGYPTQIDRTLVANGRIVKTGTGEALLNDPEIRSAYLEGAH